MRGSTACLLLGLAVLSACRGGTPSPIAGLTPAPSPSVEPSPGPDQATGTSSPAPAATSGATGPALEGLQRLTDDPARDESPAWSWDGQRLAFSSDRTGVYEIFAMQADGSGLVQLTEDPGTFLKDDPAWSPGDDQLAFTLHSDISRIFAFDVASAESQPFDPNQPIAGGLPQPLSDFNTDALSPAWSPDGQRLALIMYDGDLVRQLFALDLESGRTTQLTAGGAPAFKPSWSPDGEVIAFSQDLDGNQDIYVIHADGSGLAQLTHEPGYDSRPSWSPDGQYLVFSSDRDGSYGLHLMRADGSYLLRLDTGPGEAFTPSWSPDGRFIAFASDRDGNLELYRIDAPSPAP